MAIPPGLLETFPTGLAYRAGEVGTTEEPWSFTSLRQAESSKCSQDEPDWNRLDEWFAAIEELRESTQPEHSRCRSEEEVVVGQTEERCHEIQRRQDLGNRLVCWLNSVPTFETRCHDAEDE